jgi:hypothetical protein
MSDFVSSLNPSGFLSGDFLIATLPPASQYPRQYAWVTDLYDGQGDRVISDGTYWKPCRPMAMNASAPSNGVFGALKSCPTQLITGAIVSAVAYTFSTAFAYPGARIRVCRKATGLLGFTVGGLNLALNSWADWEFDPASGLYVQTASGGLL